MDLIRLVFDRLAAAGSPDADQRANIYTECRREVAMKHLDATDRAAAVSELERVIRRQEMQALYEESFL